MRGVAGKCVVNLVWPIQRIILHATGYITAHRLTVLMLVLLLSGLIMLDVWLAENLGLGW